jgi:hypothetical protein
MFPPGCVPHPLRELDEREITGLVLREGPRWLHLNCLAFLRTAMQSSGSG